MDQNQIKDRIRIRITIQFRYMIAAVKISVRMRVYTQLGYSLFVCFFSVNSFLLFCFHWILHCNLQIILLTLHLLVCLVIYYFLYTELLITLIILSLYSLHFAFTVDIIFFFFLIFLQIYMVMLLHYIFKFLELIKCKQINEYNFHQGSYLKSLLGF